MFDSRLRSHVQAQIADLLWVEDRSFASYMFLEAWESAEKADREFDEGAMECQMDAVEDSSLPLNPPHARHEVIFLATRNDRRLGEQFLTKMAEDYERFGGDGNSVLPIEGPSKAAQGEVDRLQVAKKLLESGDIEQATQFAGQSPNHLTASILTFLSLLREKNPNTADQLYSRLLDRAVNDPSADATTASLLSSYVFSPGVYLTFTSRGFPTWVQTNGLNNHVEVSPNIRSAFLSASSRILLRPLVQYPGPAAITQRVCYLVITRLLPMFERFDANTAIQLRSRLIQLASVVPPNLKSPETVSRMRTGIDYGDSRYDAQNMIEHADRLANLTERDRIYVRASVSAAERGDANPQEVVNKISSTEIRAQVRSYVYLVQAKNALERRSVEKALELARVEELSPFHRVWIYIETARILGPKQPKLATKVLLEAVPVARRISEGDPDSARAMIAIATQFMKVDRAAAGAYVTEAITAANRVDHFSGENTTIAVTLETPIGNWMASYGNQDFALKSLFLELIRDDFFQAIISAKNLNGKEARAVALISIAHVALKRDKRDPDAP